MKAVVATFNQEKALVGAFSVITNLRMELFGALVVTCNLDPDDQIFKIPDLTYCSLAKLPPKKSVTVI